MSSTAGLSVFVVGQVRKSRRSRRILPALTSFAVTLGRLDVHVMQVSILTDDDIGVFNGLPSCLFFFLGVL